MFVVLALLQGLAPLLHTHLTASAVSAQSGVHLPVSIAHAGHSGTAVSVTCGALDESGVITVPPELRRDAIAVPAMACAFHSTVSDAWQRQVAADWRSPRVDLPVAEPPVLLPPSQGPPVSA